SRTERDQLLPNPFSHRKYTVCQGPPCSLLPPASDRGLHARSGYKTAAASCGICKVFWYCLKSSVSYLLRAAREMPVASDSCSSVRPLSVRKSLSRSGIVSLMFISAPPLVLLLNYSTDFYK